MKMKIKIEIKSLLLGTLLLISLFAIVILIKRNYLNYQNNHKNQVENFSNSEDQLNKILGNNDNQYQLKKLVQTKATDQFGSLVWDNFSFLGSVPNCSPIENGNQCPISIYEPYLDSGYQSIGQIITKSHTNPRHEVVSDPRQPKTPEIDNSTNLKAIIVSGNTIKYPIDFKKVVSFGNGSMTNRLENKEKLIKLEKKINFQDYYPKLIETFSKHDTETGQEIIQKFTKLRQYFTEDFQTTASFSSRGGQTLSNLSQLGGQYYKDADFPYKVYNFQLAMLNTNFYNLSSLNYSGSTKNQLQNRASQFENSLTYQDVDTRKQGRVRQRSLGRFKQTNGQLFEQFWNKYPLQERKEITARLRTKGYLKDLPENVSDIKTILEKYFQGIFYMIECPKGFQCTINHGNKQTILGSPSSKDYFISVFYPSFGLEKLSLKSIAFQTHPDYFKHLLDTRFQTLQDLVSQAQIARQKEKTGQYYQITVWQPQAPDGFIALGYVATNSQEKPNKNSVVCLPKNCVKAFNRRTWIPEDKVWEVVVNKTKYSFWRNPYLGTMVVSVGNKLPNQIPVADKQSKWLCYDIIPCIKECDYVDRLATADKKSKNLCRAYKKVNKEMGGDNSQYNQADWEETKQLRGMVNERKTYLKDLVERIKKTLKEEELYQELTKAHHRYHFRNSVEEQREIEDKIVNKLLNEKGLKVDVLAPGGLGKVRQLLQTLVKQEYNPEEPICDDCPMCPAPDLEGLVKLKDLGGCYGCIEHLVAELIGDLSNSGEEIPEELKKLQEEINQGQLV